jgi:glycosyltransferase involved in cell wall biosynthesis
MTLTLLQAEAGVDPALGEGYGFPFVSHLVLELVRRGHDVSAFTLAETLTEPRAFRRGNLVVHVCPYRPRGRDRAKDFFRAERKGLATAITAESPQVVHAHWTYEFAQAALAVGQPTLVTAHDWPPRIFQATPDKYRAMRLLQGMSTILRSRELTAPSPYLADRVSQWRRRPVRLIPNGTPIREERLVAGPRHTWPVIGAVNNGWGTRKNVSSLLEAFAKFRVGFPDAQLVLAGQDYEPDGRAWQWARSAGILEGVQFCGPLPPEEVASFMSDLDLFVHPSLEETFGMVLVEALAAGIPVVAGSRSGAVPWVLDYGRNGLLVDVTSPSALASGMQRVLDQRDLYDQLASSGRAYVQDRFSIERVIDQYEQEYERLISDQPRTGRLTRRPWSSR